MSDARRHGAAGSRGRAGAVPAARGLGLLTNSVAHEFNNFLQILIGYIDGLKRRLGDRPEPFIQRALSRSADATERAAILTPSSWAIPAGSPRTCARWISTPSWPTLAERLAPDFPPGILRLTVNTTRACPGRSATRTQIEFACGIWSPMPARRCRPAAR